MKIETVVNIPDDRQITVKLPPDAPLGEHWIELMIHETKEEKENSSVKKKFHSFAWENWPVDCTFRREDLYKDEDH